MFGDVIQTSSKLPEPLQSSKASWKSTVLAFLEMPLPRQLSNCRHSLRRLAVVPICSRGCCFLEQHKQRASLLEEPAHAGLLPCWERAISKRAAGSRPRSVLMQMCQTCSANFRVGWNKTVLASSVAPLGLCPRTVSIVNWLAKALLFGYYVARPHSFLFTSIWRVLKIFINPISSRAFRSHVLSSKNTHARELSVSKVSAMKSVNRNNARQLRWPILQCE